MFQLLHERIRDAISISDAEWDFCKSLFLPKRVRRRQFLLQEGEICRYTAFVEKGILRTYTIDEKGAEHILQFAQEGWWMADLDSFIHQGATIFNMEAIEDCELLLINKPNWEDLLARVPVFERYFRILIQNNLISTQRRLIRSMTETVEDQYIKLLETYPDCVRRVPQHMIAAYLGVTRESLSRIRAQMSLRKP